MTTTMIRGRREWQRRWEGVCGADLFLRVGLGRWGKRTGWSAPAQRPTICSATLN